MSLYLRVADEGTGFDDPIHAMQHAMNASRRNLPYIQRINAIALTVLLHFLFVIIVLQVFCYSLMAIMPKG